MKLINVETVIHSVRGCW